eukprot:SAG31_NODE_3100_length_4675_cov_3.664117_6_plen_48_part_00
MFASVSFRITTIGFVIDNLLESTELISKYRAGGTNANLVLDSADSKS